MAIELMTIDELLAWWRAHPNESAEPGNSECCVIAVPLAERRDGREVLVKPTVKEHTTGAIVPGVVEMYNDEFGLEQIPLPPELDKLAIAFDAMQGDGDFYGDTDPDEDQVCADRCVELIERIKREVAG